eukprot:c32180_g1_i1.p1 GENE.c32180_g1_i1~~c32180_g1_i1.p1  ORF type:complete len:271 (+),score=38.17 c32180_g1_i1:27-815(+)
MMRAGVLVVVVALSVNALESQGDVQVYSYSFQTPEQNSTTPPIDFPGKVAEGDAMGLVCPNADVQPPPGLFRRYVCHVFPDRLGRRRRRPKQDCVFAQVGVRGMEAMREALDRTEATLGLETDNVDLWWMAHNMMHQGIVYGDEHGRYDFSSGYYCGQPADRVGYKWHGWVCQDPQELVQAYKPITNDTVALDNWFPKQYNLVGRKFNCERMWMAEQLVAQYYDSCTHPDTSNSYRLAWRNCHSYVDDVVAKYDELEADQAK